MPVFYLTDKHIFPPPHLAEKEGLLAVGGDLVEDRLLLAYRMGIFPWSPDPRLVLYPEEIKVSKTLKKIIKKDKFDITMDQAFDEVIEACAQIRSENNEGTWIGKDMIKAYCGLHKSGYAHSVEAWYKGELVGGLYGVSLGKSFFGESMFTRISNASNVVFVKQIPRDLFLQQLKKSLCKPTIKGKWSFETKEISHRPTPTHTDKLSNA